MWNTPENSFSRIITTSINTVYWLFSDYPEWIGQVVVGSLIGILAGAFLYFFGKQVFYFLVISFISLWMLWYIKIILIQTHIIYTIIGYEVHNTQEIMAIIKEFIKNHPIELISALFSGCAIGKFISRYKVHV